MTEYSSIKIDTRCHPYYFLFRLEFDFGFFIKPWRNSLCIWTISQEILDLERSFWGCLPFKLTTVGEAWWPLQWRSKRYHLQHRQEYHQQQNKTITRQEILPVSLYWSTMSFLTYDTYANVAWLSPTRTDTTSFPSNWLLFTHALKRRGKNRRKKNCLKCISRLQLAGHD